MTSTQPSVIDQIEQQEPDATRTPGRSGDTLSYLRRNRLVTVTPQSNGTVRVTTWIHYGGQDGNGWCDGRDYKSARGALRMIRAHLNWTPPTD